MIASVVGMPHIDPVFVIVPVLLWFVGVVVWLSMFIAGEDV